MSIYYYIVKQTQLQSLSQNPARKQNKTVCTMFMDDAVWKPTWKIFVTLYNKYQPSLFPINIHINAFFLLESFFFNILSIKATIEQENKLITVDNVFALGTRD